MENENDECQADASLKQATDVERVVQRWITAFNAHDVTHIASLYADDAELFDTGMKYPRQGRDQITAWFTRRFQQMPTLHYTPTQFFWHDGQAAVCWIAQGHTPALLRQRWLSRPFQIDGVSIFRLRSDAIAWQHGYYDHLQVAERVLPPLRWLPLRL